MLTGVPGRVGAQLPRRPGARFHPDSSVTAQSLLRTAGEHARDRQWAEAIELYRRVIREHGGTVALVPPEEPGADPRLGSQLFVDVRQECHRRLAALPAEALAIYRRRVDPEAERLFREGRANRDRAALRRVVEESFCSSWADDALNALGDLAFRDGRFGEALACYRRIVSDDPATLAVPEPDLPEASIAAKKVLCRAALGDRDLAAAVEEFDRDYPGAEGALAGRKGPLRESLAAAVRSDGLAVPAPSDDRWSTFAGSASRSRVAPAPVDVGSFQWKVRLMPVPARQPGPMAPRMPPAFGAGPPRADRGLAYHPIVLGDQVVVADANRLSAYNLGDRPISGAANAAGEAEVKVAWDQALSRETSAPLARNMTAGTPRHTVTGYGDRIFARLGPSGARMGPSFVVAVRNNREVDGKLLWRRASNDVALPRGAAGAVARAAVFEGTPLADERNVYVALTEAGVMTALYVACLDAETGATRWVRFVGEATPPGDAFGEDIGSRLLTLDAGTVYYQTNLGVVAALDVETGALHWLATYPQRDGRGEPGGTERDLNPAVAHDGLVIVAPADSPEILAFDAHTGRLAWRNEKMGDVAHVLGVAKGRLVATGNRVHFLDVRNGRSLGYWPPSGAGYTGYGRGLLAGEQVYWPTRTEIHVLDVATGLKSDRGPIPLQQAFGTTGGNLAVGDGYLVVAQEDALVVFCQNSRLIDRIRETIAAAPEAASNHLRLARVAEATGQDDLALESLESAARLARPGESFDGQPLAELAQAQRFRLLMRLGSRAGEGRDWAAAASRYEGAAQVARTDRDRLAARLLLAEALDRRGEPAQAVALLQGVLAEERLRGLTVSADAQRTVRADLLIADRLEGILGTRGRALYEPFEGQARRLLERGRSEGDARLLEEVARAYPVAAVVPESLLRLAALHEKRGEPAEAARAYKRLLAVAPDDASRARALLGLGRAYESQGYWVPARDALGRAQARHGGLRLQPGGPTVADLVAGRLSRAPFDQMTADLAEPPVEAPLERAWALRWGVAVHPLAAEGVPPLPSVGRVFLVEGNNLRPIDPESGQYGWSADLGGEATWVGYLSDRVLAATERKLVALHARSGEVLWTLEAGPGPAGRKVADPFAKPGRPEEPAAPATLSGVRVVGNRVFALRGDRELVAVDGDSGLLDWSFAPEAGAIHPRLHVGPGRAVLQVREPNAVVVLDTETGLRRARYPQEEQEQAWARDPMPVDEDHLALVIDARTVALWDAGRGSYAWTYREPSALPRSGPPLLLGDAGRLLVLRDGSELVRLDVVNGHRVWSRVLGIEDLSEYPEALAYDGDRVYCATGRTLTAYDLSSGEPLWRRHLSGPAAGWSVALAERSVLAYPDPARSQERGGFDGLPLVFCRRDDGRPVQRVYLATQPSELVVRLAPGSVVVATQDGGWALASRRAMDAVGGHR